jgi:urease accessory protein
VHDTSAVKDPGIGHTHCGGAALLLLADGRFPAGTHAHSGGVEAAVALEGLRDLRGLESFLRGRAATTGAVSAAFAAAACASTSRGTNDFDADIARLDGELNARIPSPALRSVSRRLGRQLLRAGGRVWPHPQLDRLVALAPSGPHQPIALGAVASAARLDVHAAAAAAVHDAVTGPATAAIRLLGLDPFAVHATLARLGPQLDEIADAAVADACVRPDALPAWSAPLLDIGGERHATWEVRLFAS